MIFLILMTIVLLSGSFVLAAKPTNNPSVTPTSAQNPSPTPKDEGIQDEVEEKIKEIRDQVKEKVREKIQEVQQGAKRAYAGKITQISESVITISGNSGERSIETSTDTKIIGKNNKAIELKDLQVGQFIIAMGYVKDQNILDARRIVVVNQPKPPTIEVAVGKVTDISAEEKLLTVRSEKKGLVYTIEVTNKTKITKKLDTKVTTAKFSDIKKDDRVVCIGTPTQNEEKIIEAKLIHVIPGLALGQIKPSTTPTPVPPTSPTPRPTQE